RSLDHSTVFGGSSFRRSVSLSVLLLLGLLAGCADSSSTSLHPGLTPTAKLSLPALRGNIQEFAIPTPRSDSYGITTGPDGNLWFTESKPYKIARITPSGTLTEYSIPTPPHTNPFVTDIVTGADGNLWFTAVSDAGNIGRITPQGVFTLFPIASPNGSPIGIVAGPDNALWFTEASANKIGRITTSGIVTEFAIPTPQGNPIGITVGPDGALWFTESGRFTGGVLSGGNKIGRVTPQGTITEFSIPTPQSGPIAITAGSDGNLWFTEEIGNKIGRITTSGLITEFAVPTQGDPHEIIAGADGAFWFTEGRANKIGRITSQGVITEFTVPTPKGYPWAITSGPDNTIWFTERIGKVGKLS
ncbi:MAG: virginiamycin B lyase family protein, partial [bacterium]